MKNPLTPAGIETATFRFVAQHLNHCATAVPQVEVSVWQIPDAVCAVLSFWWWTENPSETCTASYRNKEIVKRCFLLVVLCEPCTIRHNPAGTPYHHKHTIVTANNNGSSKLNRETRKGLSSLTFMLHWFLARRGLLRQIAIKIVWCSPTSWISEKKQQANSPICCTCTGHWSQSP
jgi:hypothetical protein